MEDTLRAELINLKQVVLGELKAEHATLQAEHVASMGELAAVSEDREVARRELMELAEEAAQEKKALTEHLRRVRTDVYAQEQAKLEEMVRIDLIIPSTMTFRITQSTYMTYAW